MRLYFIRHGQSANNLLYDQTGSDAGRSDDPLLTDAGWQQARLTGEFMRSGKDQWDGEKEGAGFGLTHLYCSPMFRALATANEIAQACGLSLHIWSDWHEQGGMYLAHDAEGWLEQRPGMTRAAIESQFPLAIADERIQDSGWWNRPFEADEERPLRARRVYQELLARHGGSDDRVAVVSHGGFYVRFVAALLGKDDLRPVWLRMNNTGISRFDFNERDRTMVFHNAVGHLPGRLLT